MRLLKTRRIVNNRRGVSAVISNLILIAAVIGVGFIVLAWSQYQATSYNNQYGIAIQRDTDKLRERLAFEFIHYETGNLTVYLMNSGTIGEVSIANVYVNNIACGAPTELLLMNGTSVDHLNPTEQGYFTISPPPSLASGENYPIVVVTGRGSSFVATFAT